MRRSGAGSAQGQQTPQPFQQQVSKNAFHAYNFSCSYANSRMLLGDIRIMVNINQVADLVSCRLSQTHLPLAKKYDVLPYCPIPWSDIT
jgi:hypothetical protein